MIQLYIAKLLNSNIKKDVFKTELFKIVGKEFIFDICIYYLLKILAHSNTNNWDMISVAQISVKAGKEIVNKYLRIKKGDDTTAYRDWVKVYLKNNTELSKLIEKDD